MLTTQTPKREDQEGQLWVIFCVHLFGESRTLRVWQARLKKKEVFLKQSFYWLQFTSQTQTCVQLCGLNLWQLQKAHKYQKVWHLALPSSNSLLVTWKRDLKRLLGVLSWPSKSFGQLQMSVSGLCALKSDLLSTGETRLHLLVSLLPNSL